MGKYVIVVESGSDVTPELCERYGIVRVPMHVTIGDETVEDGSIDPLEIYSRCNEFGVMPKTSGCAPADFAHVYDRIHAEQPDATILHLAYSEVTTCSHQSSKIAAKGRDYVFSMDTRFVSVGQSLVAVETAKYIEAHPDATVDELMQIMPGPDFPTGAIIMGSAGIKQSYETGRGSITVRAKAHVESTKTGRSRLVFTEIPYMVNKGTLQEKIAQLVNDKRIEGISDMRDESNQKGIRLVIELKKGVIPQVVLNNLYKYTSLQTVSYTHLTLPTICSV